MLSVLPTPPFGLIRATVFGRVTPGCVRILRSTSASSRSPLETSSRCSLPAQPPRRVIRRRPPVDERRGMDVAAAEGWC